MKRILYDFLILILFISLFLSFKNYFKEKKEVKIIENEIKISEINSINDEIDKYKNKYSNNDIVGYLKIDSKINTLLVQGKDNKFYLNHLINKKKNILGSVFIDYRVNLKKFSKIIIYGHSSERYDLPFNKLHDFLKENYSKKLQININNKIFNYELISIKITNDNSHLKLNYNEIEWIKYLESLKQNNLYKNDFIIDKNMEVLVLQTCYKNKFLILSYRKVN